MTIFHDGNMSIFHMVTTYKDVSSLEVLTRTPGGQNLPFWKYNYTEDGPENVMSCGQGCMSPLSSLGHAPLPGTLRCTARACTAHVWGEMPRQAGGGGGGYLSEAIVTRSR